MRLSTVLAHTIAAAVVVSAASCSPPPQPTYADITFQTRCNSLAGPSITGCTEPLTRSIFGFSGDMGTRFSCSIGNHGALRTVNFSASAVDPSGVPIGVSLSGATVATGGGTPSGQSTFTWRDGNTYGGMASGTMPTAAQPCQISSINFTTDSGTGLPLMTVSAHCIEAPSIPAASPAIVRSVSHDGNNMGDNIRPFEIKFFSCPVI